MAYQVILGRIALNDLAKIRDYISRENPEAASAFMDALVKESKSLTTFPNRGGQLADRPGVRFTVHKNYLITYRIVEAKLEVRILRFWHAARERRYLRPDHKISG